MAAKGYPGAYARGTVIEGLDDAGEVEGVEIFHAGTKAEGGKILANGGRVLNVSAIGKTVREAQARAYEAVSPHPLARRLLPPRHRLARGGTGEATGGALMPDLADLYPGYASRFIDTSAGRIFARVGESGKPPLLLLHGHPQSNVMWHRVAPLLAPHFTLVLADLPGYGWSAAPEANDEHAPYTKRAMAAAMIEVMDQLGFARFRLAGHDRGGRVGYRLALDHPGRLEQLAVLDIVPTWDMWHRMSAALASRAWHWMFLALPAPFPETLIGHDPTFFFDARARAGANAKTVSIFDPARAGALPCRLRGPAAHPRHVRGLSRRPHHRSRARRGRPRRRQEDRLPGARALGLGRPAGKCRA